MQVFAAAIWLTFSLAKLALALIVFAAEVAVALITFVATMVAWAYRRITASHNPATRS